MKKIDINLLKIILEEIYKNNKITEKYLSDKYEVSERTIRRYIKILKENKIIIIENYGKKKKWKILKETDIF